MSKQNIGYCGKFKFCFFTRNGGVSKKSFRSLNCSYNLSDNAENVRDNREIVKKKFCKEKEIILLNQIHSNKVIFLEKKSRIVTADGVVSNKKDFCLGILTADCAPIVIIGKRNFGIIHVGWRGAFNNIIKNAVKVFLSKGEIITDLNFFVGPHLKTKSFEVKMDFIAKFFKDTETSKKFIIKKKDKYFFDFSKFIKKKVLDLGISKIKISTVDTFSNPQKFFSYRYYSKKGIINCGRQISLVSFK